jgi:hypothetical protein
MADTVTIPGVGPTSKQTVIVAGAVGAGILGYAWYRRRKSSSLTAVGNVNDLIGATAYTGAPNAAGATGDSSVPGGTLPKTSIATNADWSQAVIAFLASNGNFDPGALATALGKYLGRDAAGLTDAEVSMVQAARAAFGDPPIGGPYAIIHASPSGNGSGNDYPGDPTQQKPPVPGANPHTWETQAGDTLLNLVPRLYATDPGVNPPTAANLQHRRNVAEAIYATNMFIIPPGIDTPLPPGRFITYY